MLEHSKSNLERVSVHHIGNKTNDEPLILSSGSLDIADDRLKGLLKKFFLSSLPANELYTFTFSNGDFKLNALYNYCIQIFKDPASFHRVSIDIGRHLYEVSNHPNIKEGDLFVAYFSDLIIEGFTVDALGLFKSENKQTFLQLSSEHEDFSLEYEDGINIDKLDKGCLIFNIDEEEGFRVCMVDKGNKSSDAQFWKDLFLMLRPCSDGYHHTKQFLEITKNYITEQLTEEFEVAKADQIDVLNRSIEYFKTHEDFDKANFEVEVLQHANVIESFRRYDQDYRGQNNIDIDDHFEISPHAVKKQARIFKSVLKLDKNFHIYIHGDKELIERGVEEDGRKYYKIYYKEES